MGDGESGERPGRGDDLESSLANMIVQELAVRDEVLRFCADVERLPLEGPDAEVFRDELSARAHELREFIAQRALFLKALPSPGELFERIELDDPDCDTEAAQVALIAESASASLAVVAAQVRLFGEMRRRGLPV